jgi:hypothetical protein
MNLDINDADSGAVFSPDRKYRYALWRSGRGCSCRDTDALMCSIKSQPIMYPDTARCECRCHRPATFRYLLFVGLNPSKADAERSDPTVSQMLGRAYRMGFDGLLVGNCFAYVSTDPNGMKAVEDPCGPDNMAYLDLLARRASMVIAGWGNGAGEQGKRVERLLRAAGPVHVLDLTGSGNPRHPRGVSLKIEPQEWRAE